jgi:hypothetical protein
MIGALVLLLYAAAFSRAAACGSQAMRSCPAATGGGTVWASTGRSGQTRADHAKGSAQGTRIAAHPVPDGPTPSAPAPAPSGRLPLLRWSPVAAAVGAAEDHGASTDVSPPHRERALRDVARFNPRLPLARVRVGVRGMQPRWQPRWHPPRRDPARPPAGRAPPRLLEQAPADVVGGGCAWRAGAVPPGLSHGRSWQPWVPRLAAPRSASRGAGS